MRLIVDCGATKTEWCLTDDFGTEINRFYTQGFNPNYNSISLLENSIHSILQSIDPLTVENIFYYGTGCLLPQNTILISECLQKYFSIATIEVKTDMLAASRSLSGTEAGIICILGTGSNSCVYDGTEIVDRAVSLGYILGDEGSGYSIGKEIVKSYFYGLMPAELQNDFKRDFHLDLPELLQHTYHQSQASSYLGSFAVFAGKHLDHPFIKQLCFNQFNAFIDIFVLRYNQSKLYPIHCAGSISYHFNDLIKVCLINKGLQPGKICCNPMDGLLEYHRVRK